MRARHGLLLAYLCLLGFGVFTPSPPPGTEAVAPEHPSIEGLVADAIRNVLVFLPLGALLSAGGTAGFRVAISGLALSAGIELVQASIPGRYPSLIDLATNCLGSALGAALYRDRFRILSPSADVAQRMAVASLVLSLVVLVFGVWLLGPSLGGARYFAGWAPVLGHYEAYQGRIEDARIGEARLPQGAVLDSEELRRSLAADARVRLRASLHPSSPQHFAPLFTIHDASQREILVLAVRADTFVLMRRTRASDLGFDPPTHRFPNAFDARVRDEAIHSIEVRPERSSAQLEIDGRATRSTAWRPGRIWSLLLPDHRIAPRFELALDLLTLALLVLPWLHYERVLGVRFALGLCAFVLVLAVLPAIGPVTGPGLLEGGGVLLGAGLSRAVRVGVARLVASGQLGLT